ncbi:MAG TPA: CbtB-domain containing protein [Nocardioides sp.]|nr:CbtB-domain containing protein [Nocardioides sp.]
MSHPSATAAPVVEVPSIPFAQLAPWALFFGLLGSLVLFFVGADQGAVSLIAGNGVHEWVHDARHLLGYPCH